MCKRVMCLLVFCFLSGTLLASPEKQSTPVTYVKTVTGTLTHTKTDSPYPDFFHGWECKLRITYTEIEPDGDIETYVYKAYPKITFDRVNRWMCTIKSGVDVTIETRYKVKSPLRGEIITLQILSES